VDAEALDEHRLQQLRVGHDDLYIPNRGRIHTDDSIEIKYYDKPGQTLDKMAFSFTGDLGCEFGGGGQLLRR